MLFKKESILFCIVLVARDMKKSKDYNFYFIEVSFFNALLLMWYQ